jgi:hypothetical protein
MHESLTRYVCDAEAPCESCEAPRFFPVISCGTMCAACEALHFAGKVPRERTFFGAMTIDYDAGTLTGWVGLPKLLAYWNGTAVPRRMPNARPVHARRLLTTYTHAHDWDKFL